MRFGLLHEMSLKDASNKTMSKINKTRRCKRATLNESKGVGNMP